MNPRSFSLADLFAITAETVPERDALIIGDNRRSYREMAERVDQLAAWLHAQGIGQGLPHARLAAAGNEADFENEAVRRRDRGQSPFAFGRDARGAAFAHSS